MKNAFFLAVAGLGGLFACAGPQAQPSPAPQPQTSALAPQEGAAGLPLPDALGALEQRLIAARTLHVRARLATSGRIQSHFDGTVAAGSDRRLRVAFQGAFGGKDVDALFTCDGSRMHGGPRGQSFDLDCAPGLRQGFAVGFVRMGITHNVARLALGRTPEYLDGTARDHLEVVGAAHAEGETVRGMPTDRWTWALLVDHKPAADETLWLDAHSGLPLRRRVVVHFPEGDMEVGEEYDEFAVDGPIPDDTFRIEP